MQILNNLPGRILFEGNYYMIVITKVNGNWYIEYQGIIKTDVIAFMSKGKNIEQCAIAMNEILIKSEVNIINTKSNNEKS